MRRGWGRHHHTGRGELARADGSSPPSLPDRATDNTERRPSGHRACLRHNHSGAAYPLSSVQRHQVQRLTSSGDTETQSVRRDTSHRPSALLSTWPDTVHRAAGRAAPDDRQMRACAVTPDLPVLRRRPVTRGGGGDGDGRG